MEQNSVEPDRIAVSIPVKAIGKGRPRVHRHGAFTPKKTAQYENFLKIFLLNLNIIPLEGAVKMTVIFNFIRPKTVSKKRVYPIVNPDIDNLLKALLDAGNKILYKDDSQVCELNSKKVYNSVNYIKVIVEKLD